jgi:hypothetical protein
MAGRIPGGRRGMKGCCEGLAGKGDEKINRTGKKLDFLRERYIT